ncbi:MBL fold metallo-hydrolase [Thermodesulfobacteriota bacterium]
MNVKQFRYSIDNFGYLIHGKQSALAIDGGAVDAMLSFIKTQNLKLEFVANTHGHADHTVGTKALLDGSNASYITFKQLVSAEFVELEGSKIQVYHTPGHTEDSVTFHLNNILVTGDTLFNGTVGNCFTNDLKSFYRSIKRLMDLPGDTIVYAGHDYVKDSMAFAEFVEPDNPDIKTFMEKYDPGHLFSTLDEELKINPYLRFNQQPIISFLEKRGLPVETEYQRWESLMSIE